MGKIEKEGQKRYIEPAIETNHKNGKKIQSLYRSPI